MLYCILGKAGSGKDRLLKEVLSKKYEKLKVAISHTTRPIRANEIDGVDYHYISKKEFSYMEENNEFIETRKYNVINEDGIKDVWYYGLSYNALNKDYNYITIVDLQGFKELLKKLGNKNIISFYIEANKEIRKNRYMNRDNMTKDKLAEMERRFESDNEDFSLVRLDNIDYFLENDNLEDLRFNKNFILKKIRENRGQ